VRQGPDGTLDFRRLPVYFSASSRLYALLTALMEHPQGEPLRAGWSQVLGIPQSEVQFGSFGLPVVAGLVARAADEATRADEQVGLPLRDHLVREWAKPVYAGSWSRWEA
jgi:hypothetical protein